MSSVKKFGSSPVLAEIHDWLGNVVELTGGGARAYFNASQDLAKGRYDSTIELVSNFLYTFLLARNGFVLLPDGKLREQVAPLSTAEEKELVEKIRRFASWLMTLQTLKG